MKKKVKKILIITGIGIILVPLICIVIGIIVFIKYDDYINNIPTVSEQSILLLDYEPFRENNKAAILDEEPEFKILNNLPIIDGATALYPVYASFVQAVYPEGVYKIIKGPVFCNKTDKAYENLLEGKADIIFCAEPSDLQIKQFHENGKNLKLVPVGREAFVFFVNKKNTMKNLTIEDIQGIYSGKITNWKELNGKNQNIRAFQRPKNSGSQTILEKIMGDIPIMEPILENVIFSMGEIIDNVAVYKNYKNAIGYSFLYFSTEMVKNKQIKLLSIDGIYPSIETIQDNSYPFSINFYAVYIDSNKKNENIETFINWILSTQGQMLIYKTGYIPINIK